MSNEDVKALVTRLQDEADLCRNDGADDIAKLLDEAVSALEGREKDAGWVLDGSLPPKNTEVLVAFEGISLVATGQYTGSAHDKNGWCYPSENNGTCDDGSDPVVIAWMHLPPHPTHPTQEQQHG